MTIVPFRPWRPDPDQAQEVASPPFDVPTKEEAVAVACRDPRHFLHVVRAEVDLPVSTDPHDALVYEKGRYNLSRLQEQGVLVRERHPALYLYRMEDGVHRQTGVAACVRASDYNAGLIRTHELTLTSKENDRVRHMQALNAHAEPVLLTYRPTPGLREMLSHASKEAPLLTVTDSDGVRHLVWRVENSAALVAAFATVPHLYVADGHHRSAAAARLAASGSAPGHFPAVMFPADELRILAYNRAICGLRNMDEDDLLRQLSHVGRLTHPANPVPTRAGLVAMRFRRGWYELHLNEKAGSREDPYSHVAIENTLDAELLQRQVIGPLFGVQSPRTDSRYIPVGGRDSVKQLERLVDSDDATVGFSLFPPTIDQMLSVADAGTVMPPKSTWIEPKLQSGLFVHQFHEG